MFLLVQPCKVGGTKQKKQLQFGGGCFAQEKGVIKIWPVKTPYGFSVAYLCIFKKPLLDITCLGCAFGHDARGKSSNKKCYPKILVQNGDE